jgi:alkanesulfonate monooxygenase SsuD/methylene tetrahydromethanopterin reductase-like flavin-dependent oxidoreductase (luciferase family)
LVIGTGISTATAARPLTQARAAESHGYDFVSASDHPVGTEPSYETPTLLTWIAAHTSRIAVATRVLAVPFRAPALVAKWAASLQELTGGRLILGLGGGHSDAEIAALGGPALTARQKVDGLSDAIQIMHGAWTAGPFSHTGSVHTVRDLRLGPAPQQAIPVWLGTYGPRALAVTGRLADGWIPSFGFAPAQRIPDMLDRIRSAATAAGRAPDAVRAIYNVPIRVGTGARPETVTGTAADIVEQLQAFTELGFTGFNLMSDADQAEAVGAEVLPALRAMQR